MAHTFSPKKQTNENEKKNNSNSNKYNNDNDDNNNKNNNNNNNNNILIKIYITFKPETIKKVYASALKRPSTIQEYGDYLLG